MNQFTKLYPRILVTGIGGLLFLLLSLAPEYSYAQETDTTRQELELQKRKQRSLDLNQQSDRSMSGGMMTEMGTYNMPSEGQYYHPPFMGQKYLDRAVEEYRKEMEDRMGGGWFWNFLRSVSPYIRAQFTPIGPPDMIYPERDNPLWRSYTDDSKKQ